VKFYHADEGWVITGGTFTRSPNSAKRENSEPELRLHQSPPGPPARKRAAHELLFANAKYFAGQFCLFPRDRTVIEQSLQ
jgi:hypothetical protein